MIDSHPYINKLILILINRNYSEQSINTSDKAEANVIQKLACDSFNLAVVADAAVLSKPEEEIAPGVW